jgi:hypothetical protein
MVLGLFAGIHLFIRTYDQHMLGLLCRHLDYHHMVDLLHIEIGDQTELEQVAPFEAAQDRANMFSVNMYLSWSLNELIKQNMASDTSTPDFSEKMILAATTLEAIKVVA